MYTHICILLTLCVCVCVCDYKGKNKVMLADITSDLKNSGEVTGQGLKGDKNFVFLFLG